MARTSFTFLFKILPPDLFLLNLHQLVTAATIPNVWAFVFSTDVSGDTRQKFILRVPWELLWSLFYHSYMDKTPVKNHDFALSSMPWDFSVQLRPTGLSAAQFCHRVCQTHLLGKDRERRHEDLIHLRAGKRLACAKCAKDTKLHNLVKLKETGGKQWYFSQACTPCNSSLRYKQTTGML